MKLKRVNETTIKCFLTAEELERFDCDYKDFITRTEKSRLLVSEVLETAGRELGYVAKSPNFDIQIVSLPDKGILLTLSERNGEAGLGYVDLEAIQELTGGEIPKINPDVVKELLNGVLENIESFLKNTKNSPENAGAPREPKEVKPFEFPKLDRNPSAEGAKKDKERPERVQDEFDKSADRMYAFDRISTIYNLAEVLPSRQRTCSSLYKYDDSYFVLLSRGAASENMYLRVCIAAMEFGKTVLNANAVDIIKRDGKLLVEGDCLKKLKVKK